MYGCLTLVMSVLHIVVSVLMTIEMSNDLLTNRLSVSFKLRQVTHRRTSTSDTYFVTQSRSQ